MISTFLSCLKRSNMKIYLRLKTGKFIIIDGDLDFTLKDIKEILFLRYEGIPLQNFIIHPGNENQTIAELGGTVFNLTINDLSDDMLMQLGENVALMPALDIPSISNNNNSLDEDPNSYFPTETLDIVKCISKKCTTPIRMHNVSDAFQIKIAIYLFVMDIFEKNAGNVEISKLSCIFTKIILGVTLSNDEEAIARPFLLTDDQLLVNIINSDGNDIDAYREFYNQCLSYLAQLTSPFYSLNASMHSLNSSQEINITEYVKGIAEMPLLFSQTLPVLSLVNANPAATKIVPNDALLVETESDSSESENEYVKEGKKESKDHLRKK